MTKRQESMFAYMISGWGIVIFGSVISELVVEIAGMILVVAGITIASRD